MVTKESATSSVIRGSVDVILNDEKYRDKWLSDEVLYRIMLNLFPEMVVCENVSRGI